MQGDAKDTYDAANEVIFKLNKTVICFTWVRDWPQRRQWELRDRTFSTEHLFAFNTNRSLGNLKVIL